KIPGLRRTSAPLCMEPRDSFVDWIEGSCLMLRRSSLDAIGLLDEQFFMYSEDEDICWRLNAAGWQVCYTTKATVSHIGGASASADRHANLERFYSSQIQLLRKHRGKAQSRLFVILTGIALRAKLLRSAVRSDHTAASEWRSRIIALKSARTSSTVMSSPGEGP
ncbi:MAG: glycosyltransferase family 2 protein, partial [Blastocatellia bacterium]